MLKIKDESGEVLAVLKDEDASPQLTEAGEQKKKTRKTEEVETEEGKPEDDR